MHKPPNWKRRALLGILLCLLLGIACCIGVARWYSEAAPAVINEAPPGLAVEEVRFPSGTGGELVAWLSEVKEPRGMVILLHGIRSNRRSMAARARFFASNGCHTVCLDFQAHGESEGKRITMGHLESQDAAAAVAWMQARYPGLPLIVNGTSLGGAAAVMARYETPPEALVIESVFSDVPTAGANRMEMVLGSWARPLHLLLTLQMRPMLGVSAWKLSPAESIRSCTMPLLVIHGGLDDHAKLEEGRLLAANAGGEAALWIVEDAAHVDLHEHRPAAWEAEVLAFLRPMLKRSER